MANSQFEKQTCARLKRRREIKGHDESDQTENDELPVIDKYINQEQHEKLKDYFLQKMRNYFESPKFQKAYPSLFKLLWYSSLPCSDLLGAKTGSLLRRCSWQGEDVPCSTLFNTVPTDIGMCCSFNYDSTLKNSTYTRMLQNLSNNTKEKIRMARTGKMRGLTLVVDHNSRLKSPGSLSQDNDAIQVFVGGPREFPLIQDRGFVADPGQEHFVEITAVPITASKEIQKIRPAQRKCYLPQDISLHTHTEYSYSACRLEAGLARGLAQANCSPWYLPTLPSNQGVTMCDPWQTVTFTRQMQGDGDGGGEGDGGGDGGDDGDGEGDGGNICLPDCEITKYSAHKTSAVLR